VDRMMRETIQDDEEKEPSVPLPGSRIAMQSMSGEFQAKVALEAIREEMTLAEL
jgi:hypothetical protein